jgi:hypothetical protein
VCYFVDLKFIDIFSLLINKIYGSVTGYKEPIEFDRSIQ